MVKYASLGHVGQIITDPEKQGNVYKRAERQDKFIEVNCFPLYSILLALGNPKIDYFSLDVEGDEMNILRTIPFDQVDIEVRLNKSILHTEKAFS